MDLKKKRIRKGKLNWASSIKLRNPEKVFPGVNVHISSLPIKYRNYTTHFGWTEEYTAYLRLA